MLDDVRRFSTDAFTEALRPSAWSEALAQASIVPAPGTDPLRTMTDRGLMLPLTDATIAYVVAGILEVRDATTVIINRELSSWVRGAETEDSPLTVGEDDLTLVPADTALHAFKPRRSGA